MLDHERPEEYTLAISPSKKAVPARTRRFPSDGLAEPVPFGVMLYGMNGREITNLDDAVAKIVDQAEVSRFYVLFSTSGHDIGHMVNPYGLYFNKNELNREQVKRGKNRYEFKEVDREVFYTYINFLQSRNESFLRVAERMVLDA